MTRSKLILALSVVVGLAIGVGAGFLLGSHSRNADVAHARSQLATVKNSAAVTTASLEAYQAREEELKSREAIAPKLPTGEFPKGYPKIVKTSSLDELMRGDFSEVQQVVAVAPGVWAALTDGAEMADAVAAGTFDGYCASIKAYERVYTPGEEHGGSCY